MYLCLFFLPFLADTPIISKSDVRIDEFGAKKLKNAPKKVYFREFNIGYQTIIESNTTGFDRKASTKISMTAGLDSELTEADIQSITDNAYKKVIAKLTAAGIEVIAHEEAKKIEEFQQKVNTTVGGEFSYKNGFVYTQPTGTIFFDVTSNFNEGVKDVKEAVSKQSKILGNLPMGQLLEKGSIRDNVGKISDQLGNVPVLDFGMNITFAEIMEDRKAGGSSELKGEFGLGAYPYKSAISWKGGGKLGNLESSIVFSPKNYKAFEIEGVIPREKIKNRAVGEFRTDWGSGIIYAQKKEITITNPVKADRAAYIEKVTLAIDDYLEIFISTFLEHSNSN